MNRVMFWLGCFLLFTSSNIAIADSVYLETFKESDSSDIRSNWILSSNDYIGIRFNVDKPVTVTQMFGNINAGGGSFFAAIAPIEAGNEYPEVGDGFDPRSALAYTEISSYIPDAGAEGPWDKIFETHTYLETGEYLLFFGAFTDFDSSFIVMPGAEDLTKSTIPLTDYFYYDASGYYDPPGWYGFDYGGVRAGLVVVPIPAAVWLLGSALVGLGFVGRRNSAP